jgi:hypothetical protein
MMSASTTAPMAKKARTLLSPEVARPPSRSRCPSSPAAISGVRCRTVTKSLERKSNAVAATAMSTRPGVPPSTASTSAAKVTSTV